MEDARSRQWATIIYPESAPKNFVSVIRSWKVRGFLSPLHDRDTISVDEKDGTLVSNDPALIGQDLLKKPHYHLIIFFDGKKSMKQMNEIFSTVNGVGCEKISDGKAYARYLCHLDNPEKVRYDVKDVISFGGLNYDIITRSSMDKEQNLSDILGFIRFGKIETFADLVDDVLDSGNLGYLELVMKNTYFLNEYIKSVCIRKMRVKERLYREKDGSEPIYEQE